VVFSPPAFAFELPDVSRQIRQPRSVKGAFQLTGYDELLASEYRGDL
jgi:hypothetical protein